MEKLPPCLQCISPLLSWFARSLLPFLGMPALWPLAQLPHQSKELIPLLCGWSWEAATHFALFCTEWASSSKRLFSHSSGPRPHSPRHYRAPHSCRPCSRHFSSLCHPLRLVIHCVPKIWWEAHTPKLGIFSRVWEQLLRLTSEDM